MSIASEITRISNNVADAYTAASGKGATMPATQNSANLASTISTIQTGSTPVISSLNVTPTTSAQQITAPSGTDGYSPVNVSAVTSSIDANIVAGNIKKDVQILGVTGSYEGTTPTGTVNITSNGTHNVSSYEYAEVLVPTTAPSRYLQYSTDANGKLIHDPAVSSVINLNGVTDVDSFVLAYAYQNNTTITGNIDLSGLTKISGANACYYAFYGCTGITGVDLSNLQTVGAIGGGAGCSYMFSGCTGITGTIDLSSLTELIGYGTCLQMFQNCSGITGVNLSGLKGVSAEQCCFSMFRNSGITGSLTLALCYVSGSSSCSNMFNGCAGITSVDLSKLITVSGASACNYMFSGCTGITSATLGLVSIYANGCCNGMFYGCTSLASADISHLAKIGVSNSMANMFANTALTTLSFPNLAYTATNFNASMANMLSGVTGCTVHFPAEWQTTMSSWSNVTNGFGGTNTTVLFDLPNVTTVDLTNITEIKYSRMFYQWGYNNYFPNITKVDLSSLEIISGASACYYMFSGCTGITSVDLSSLETISAASSCQNMFDGCTSLTTLSFPALKTVINNGVFNNMLNGVTGCTVHFPSNLSSYNFNCGGTNTTVLYDLAATA